ncbi:MAG: hypothetical protein R3F49_20355 [Planctomycetota bacterium]
MAGALLIAAACIALASASHAGAQDASAADDVHARVAAGDLVGALQRARDVHAPGLAARLEAEVLWSAGDLNGALAAAREGLVAAPNELALARLAADLSLALDLAHEARRHVTSLARDVALLPQGDSDRDWWLGQLAALESSTSAAERALEARDTALSRARSLGSILIAATLGALLVLLRPERRA